MIRHALVSAKPDGPDPTLIRPSDWNRDHIGELVISLGSYVLLTNIGAAYDTILPARGLGIVEVDLTGVDEIVFTVNVNKIGTGTQSWQLWNETNSAQVGVILDAAAAGNKTLTTTIANALVGVKRLRVRALSSVAADDPVFYGASLRLRRL